MKKNNGKMLAIAALVVAVVGLSIGFAAFSSVLTINTTANVTPDASEFKVEFQSGSVITPTGGATVSLSAKDGVMTLSNITVKMAKPGDVVTIKIPVKNTGNYTAYLKNIVLTDQGDHILYSDTNDTTTNKDLVDNAWEDFSMKLSVEGDTHLQNLTSDTTVTTTHSLAKGATENIIITYTYASDGAYVDGDFWLECADIVLKYSSAE